MSKNYRRDHHKRLTYAPVPGLTSNKVVSSSYLLPSENVSTYSTLSYPSLTPSTSKSSLSMSQPTMDLSTVSADLNALVNPSSTSASSLHNFFNNNYASSNSSSSETMITSVDAFSNSSTPSISSSSFSSQNLTVPGRPPGVPFHANANQSSNLSLSSPSTSLGVGSVPVHPPIMSTKEQISSSNHQGRTPSPSVIPPSLNNLANLYHSGIIYRPAYYHWFLKTEEKNGKDVWQPFSMTDSLALEQALNSGTFRISLSQTPVKGSI